MPRIFDNINGNSLDLSLDKSDVITIVITNSNFNIHYELSDGDYKFLIFNNSDSELSLNEEGTIRNSNVEINYFDLNDAKLIHKNNIEVYYGSNLTINSTYLGTNTKNIEFNLFNKERDSAISISNNVVCLNDADFSLTVSGKIEKGSKRSKCFQKSRCLTFENPKKAKILPVLLIDENDVEASHSLSSGTIDENVLFYMNSRGLSKNDALKLLLVSYLMPNEEFYSAFEDGLKIKKIADRKVEKICMM
ncbi:MAG: SufD family Fe-S cluster assembly protein [Erysipelotrichaceae bacterium]|nr:SufD family Fe-S cluster assembly protein [Erysipelotrichaceae bacterium]